MIVMILSDAQVFVDMKKKDSNYLRRSKCRNNEITCKHIILISSDSSALIELILALAFRLWSNRLLGSICCHCVKVDKLQWAFPHPTWRQLGAFTAVFPVLEYYSFVWSGLVYQSLNYCSFRFTRTYCVLNKTMAVLRTVFSKYIFWKENFMPWWELYDLFPKRPVDYMA